MTIDQGRRTRPTGGMELYAWLFMRVSGLTLIVMVLIHFAIMHVITDIQDINFAFVVKRFATPFWISYDLVDADPGLVPRPERLAHHHRRLREVAALARDVALGSVRRRIGFSCRWYGDAGYFQTRCRPRYRAIA